MSLWFIHQPIVFGVITRRSLGTKFLFHLSESTSSASPHRPRIVPPQAWRMLRLVSAFKSGPDAVEFMRSKGCLTASLDRSHCLFTASVVSLQLTLLLQSRTNPNRDIQTVCRRFLFAHPQRDRLPLRTSVSLLVGRRFVNVLYRSPLGETTSGFRPIRKVGASPDELSR